MTITGVLVARTVCKKLGRDGLREVLANLWPGDCQTCGQSLDKGETALVVDDMIVTADASLHHPGCRDTGWNDTGIITSSGDPLITHITQLLMLGMRLSSGAVEHRPTLLINPGLEQLRLRPTKRLGGWPRRSPTPSTLRCCPPGTDHRMGRFPAVPRAAIGGGMPVDLVVLAKGFRLGRSEPLTRPSGRMRIELPLR